MSRGFYFRWQSKKQRSGHLILYNILENPNKRVELDQGSKNSISPSLPAKWPKPYLETTIKL